MTKTAFFLQCVRRTLCFGISLLPECVFKNEKQSQQCSESEKELIVLLLNPFPSFRHTLHGKIKLTILDVCVGGFWYLSGDQISPQGQEYLTHSTVAGPHEKNFFVSFKIQKLWILFKNLKEPKGLLLVIEVKVRVRFQFEWNITSISCIINYVNGRISQG